MGVLMQDCSPPSFASLGEAAHGLTISSPSRPCPACDPQSGSTAYSRCSSFTRQPLHGVVII